jgi:alcohol dehydrogenase
LQTTHTARTTRRLTLTAPGKLTWITELLPPVGEDEVLLQTLSTAISIGCELPVYRGTARASRPAHYPQGMGYENVSRVVACGSSAQNIQPGNRVVAFYGQQTFAVVPVRKVIHVPEEISDELALLSILTCDTAKGVRKLDPDPAEDILVTGTGAIGLLTLFVLRAYGHESIDVVEPLIEQHALASLLGARTVWTPQDTYPRMVKLIP